MSIEAAATTPSSSAKTNKSASTDSVKTNKIGIVGATNANTSNQTHATKVRVAQFTPGGSSSATQSDYKELSDALLGDDIGMMGSEVESWNETQTRRHTAPTLTRSTSSFLPPTHPQSHHSTPRQTQHAPPPQTPSPAQAFFASPPVQLTRHASLPVNMMRHPHHQPPMMQMQMHPAMPYALAGPPHMMAMPPPSLARQHSHTGYVIHAAPHPHGHPHAGYGMPRLVAFHHPMSPMSPMHHVPMHHHHPMNNNSINLSVSHQQHQHQHHQQQLQRQPLMAFKSEPKSNNHEPMPFTGMSDARMSLGEIDSIALAVLSEPSKNKESKPNSSNDEDNNSSEEKENDDNDDEDKDKDNNSDSVEMLFKPSTASSIGCGQDLEKALDSLDRFLPEADQDLFRPSDFRVSDFRPSDLAAMIAPPPPSSSSSMLPMQPVVTSHMVTPRPTTSMGMSMGGRASLPLIMSPHVKTVTSPAHTMAMMMAMPLHHPHLVSNGHNHNHNHSHSHTPRASPKPMATCKVGGCDRRVRSKGFCKTHGGGRKCSIEGCKKSSQNGEFCIGHGGGKKCKQDGCAKAAQSHGLCKAHGGGARCKYPNCNKSSQGGGLCRAHGGGKRCQAAGCPKGAQRGNFCATHGGFRNCKIDGCVRTDRGGGFCEVHRRGRLCKIDGCKKLSRNQGMCTMHIREEKQDGEEGDCGGEEMDEDDEEEMDVHDGGFVSSSCSDVEGSGIDA